MDRLIYFDNNATTKPLPEVVEAMSPFLHDEYANPSSVHRFGQSVRHRLECAREQVAALIGASPREVIFTSGGTESINTAIRGLLAHRPQCRRIVTTAVEHSATLRVLERLADEGYAVDTVGVDHDGRLDREAWTARLRDDTALATLLHANNETGVLFDVGELAAEACARGIPVHVDAVQSAGKIPIRVRDWPVQAVSLSAHKFHGPKGIGALYLRRRTPFEPLLLGGSHEFRRRGGTENVPGIIGMGVAAEIALRDMDACAKRVGALRDRLEQGLLERIEGTSVNGRNAPRIHNTTNVAFRGLEAEAILILLSEAGLCASAGAACSSGSLEPSHVLRAMRIDPALAHGSIRFSLSRFNTEEEVDEALKIIPECIARLAALQRT